MPMAPANDLYDAVGETCGSVSVIGRQKLRSRFAFKLNEFFPGLAKQKVLLILKGCRGMMCVHRSLSLGLWFPPNRLRFTDGRKPSVLQDERRIESLKPKARGFLV